MLSYLGCTPVFPIFTNIHFCIVPIQKGSRPPLPPSEIRRGGQELECLGNRKNPTRTKNMVGVFFLFRSLCNQYCFILLTRCPPCYKFWWGEGATGRFPSYEGKH